MSQCHDSYPCTEGQPETAEDKFTTLHIAHPAVGGTRPGRVPVPHDCDVLSNEHGGTRSVRVVGSLDWATAGEFEGFLCDNCVEPVVLVDLTAARLDAAGTGALLVATERATARAQQIIIVATNPLQLSVLEATGLNAVVPIAASEAAALAWCNRELVQR
jgi:anti-anti-sigma factor